MEKQELEELLGYSVTDNLFKGALGHTRNKQEYRQAIRSLSLETAGYQLHLKSLLITSP